MMLSPYKEENKMLNETEERLFWESYEAGSTTASEIAKFIMDCQGIRENFESFLDKVEEYAKVNLNWSLPRDGFPD